MNTPPDKPPTQESIEAAKRYSEYLQRRFAVSLPALPEHKPQPTDYERGFMDGYLAGGSSGYQAGLRKAQEIITKH